MLSARKPRDVRMLSALLSAVEHHDLRGTCTQPPHRVPMFLSMRMGELL